jgi:hypothetical protein
MKFLFIALLACIFFSCKNHEDQLKEKIEPALKSISVEEGLVSKVDSIKIYKIDTLTDVQLKQREIADLNTKSAYYIQTADKCMAQSKLEKSAENIKKLNGEAQLYNDSSTTCQLQATALQRRMDGHKFDSKTFKGYVVSFGLSGSDKKNAAVKKDSVTLFLSPDLKAVPATKI